MQPFQQEFARIVEHWKAAIERLADLDAVAAPQAWQALEHYLGVSLRQALTTVVARLRQMVHEFEAQLRVSSDVSVDQLQARLVELRKAHFRAETTVDFYADALAARSIPKTAALLRACDHIATRSMAEALAPMGREVPAALTYVDKGMGASILKAGLRLWDGTIDNPVASIKITRHNLLRPSAIVHEAGHQVAHTLGWVPELADAFTRGLGQSIGSYWARCASEVAADGYAHVHTGYAAAAALHDVLDGGDDTVFRYLEGDPHPVSYIRVLMVIEMCRRTFGAGPWDMLAAAWTTKHRIDRSPRDIRDLLRASVQKLPQIVEIVLYTPYRAFGGRALTQLINPARVSPAALRELKRDAGETAFTSPYWAWNEAIRLMALNGYLAGSGAGELRAGVTQQEEWMLRLGALRAAA